MLEEYFAVLMFYWRCVHRAVDAVQTNCIEGAMEKTPDKCESVGADKNILGGRFSAAVFCIVAAIAASAPAHALLLGEKAKGASKASLKNALRYYKRGESHETVWAKTRWYCPLRKRPGCRFEIAGRCTDIGKINVVSLRHAAVRGRKIPLGKVFNAACIYQRYPSMKNGIQVSFGDCSGWGGSASRDAHGRGFICINRNLSEQIKQERGKGLIQNKGGIEKARADLHRIFIHEMQHHVQFAEGWPRYDGGCPYNRRAMEREAYYVGEREKLNDKERKARAPHWHQSGLC